MQTQPSPDLPGGRPAPKRNWGILGTYEIILIVLVLLALIGIGMTDFAPLKSLWFWYAMVPVFGGACLIIEWTRARGRGAGVGDILKDQALHWLGVLGAVQLAFVLMRTGKLSQENIGLVMLLILSLGTFLAGLKLGWRLCLIGVFLALALLLTAFLKNILWIMLLIAAAVGIAVYFKTKDGSTSGGAPPATSAS